MLQGRTTPAPEQLLQFKKLKIVLESSRAGKHHSEMPNYVWINTVIEVIWLRSMVLKKPISN